MNVEELHNLTYRVIFTVPEEEEKVLYKGTNASIAITTQITAEQVIRALKGSGILVFSVGDRVQTNHWEKGVYRE